MTEEQHGVPILIVYALINKPYILRPPARPPVVQTLLEAGFDVYLIDWGEPPSWIASLSIDDYVNRYIDNCADVVRERSGRDSINILGYCMAARSRPCTPAVPRESREPRLMAAGLCFDATAASSNSWGGEDYYDPERVTGHLGNVPAEFLDIGFA